MEPIRLDQQKPTHTLGEDNELPNEIRLLVAPNRPCCLLAQIDPMNGLTNIGNKLFCRFGKNNQSTLLLHVTRMTMMTYSRQQFPYISGIYVASGIHIKQGYFPAFL